MKKGLSILLVLVLALCPISAMAGNWYAETAIELAERMHTLASDDAYSAFFTTSTVSLGHIKEFANSDFSAPAEAYLLTLPDMQTATSALSTLGLGNLREDLQFSTEGAKEILMRMPNIFASIISNQQFSNTMLAASAILNISETHLMPDGFQPGLLFLQYPGKYSIIVTFIQAGETTVLATAMPNYTSFITNLLDTENLRPLRMAALNHLFQEISLN